MRIFNTATSATMTCVVFPLLIAAGCASRPDIRLDKAPSLDSAAYRSFAFFDPLATDKSLYTTIISGRLKNATRAELERRNYVYDEKNPDLRVNFKLSVVDRQELRSTPVGGRVGYRLGLSELDTVDYRQGTLIVDLVDAHKNEVVWQGVAEGRVSRKSMEEPGPAVDKAVGELFTSFPLSRPSGHLASIASGSTP
jgi:hypothetical protein